MATLTPVVFFQALDNNGDPLSNGTIDSYEAGTTTPKDTYTDADETATNTNPIVLDANGRADIWLGEGAYKFVLKDSSGTTIQTVDDFVGESTGGIITYAVSSNLNLTSIYENALIIGTGSFNINLLPSADATDGFNFRVRNAGSGTITIDPDGSETINGSATLSVPAGGYVEVISDGTNWQALLTDVTASADNTFTGDNTFSGSNTFSGTNTFSGVNTYTATQIWAKGADVASASALSLGTDGNYFDITGTTAITSIDTVGVGAVIKLHFDGSLTLTHNATDLILPGGENITTAAGDEAEFVEYATGDWRCTNYTRAMGIKRILGTAYNSISTYTSLPTTLPADGTVPQSNEGDEFLTQAYTPKSATSKLRIEVHCHVGALDAVGSVGIALFKDSETDARAAAGVGIDSVTRTGVVSFVYEMTSGTTSAITFALRGGSDTSTNATLNGDGAASSYGAANSSSITITEIEQ